MNIISNNQIGTFDLPTKLINDNETDCIRAVMSQMVITKAECLYMPDVIRYMAFSELFAPVESFVKPPYYIVSAKEENDGTVKISAERGIDQWD